jgi:hypothetical protein
MSDRCACCKGQKVVLTCLGDMRPCSRCSTDAYMKWSEINYPRAPLSDRSQAKGGEND